MPRGGKRTGAGAPAKTADEKRVRVTIQVPAFILARIDRVAEYKNISRSNAVLEMIRLFFYKNCEWCDATHETPLEIDNGDLLRTDDVLCLMDDGTMTVCWYDVEDDLWVEAWSEKAVALASGKHVRHWAYLPDGPSA